MRARNPEWLHFRHVIRSAAPWPPVDDVRSGRPGKGCTCTRGPAYYAVVSLDGGGLAREPVGHNRKEAERRLRAIEVRVDQDVYEPTDNVTFAEWCDAWLSGLRRKETTRRSYRPSLGVCEAGDRAEATPEGDRVGRAGLPRAHRARAQVEEAAPQISSTTLAKHLRHLGACLQAANLRARSRRIRYAFWLPVHGQRRRGSGRATSRTTSWRSSGLSCSSRLSTHTSAGTAVVTGMRFGELAALRGITQVSWTGRSSFQGRTRPGSARTKRRAESRVPSTFDERLFDRLRQVMDQRRVRRGGNVVRRGIRSASSVASRLEKIAPKMETPTAPPIWRNSVEPDVATPSILYGTAFWAASTSTCITIPRPSPSTSR